MAVVGAGRMGSVIARRLPPDTKKIIVDTVPAKASELAETVGGSWSVSPEQAADADLIALVVPAAAVREILEKLQVLAKNLLCRSAAWITPAHKKATKVQDKNTQKGISSVGVKLFLLASMEPQAA